MLQQHAGTETTAESSTEEVCRRELDNYLGVRLNTCRSSTCRVSTEEWWRRGEYLWSRISKHRKGLSSHTSVKCVLRKEFFEGRFDMC